ncbi:hypothetical protein ACS0TY_008543 [Phlomoides rotata]
MHSSSSHSVEFTHSNHRFERVYCNYGIELQLKNSWTAENPGRRFYSSRRYNTSDCCGYFKWFDPEMCSRSKGLIPRFQKKIDRLEDEINDLMIKEKQLEAELRRTKGMERSLSLEMVELNNKHIKELDKIKKSQKFPFGIVVLACVVATIVFLKVFV